MRKVVAFENLKVVSLQSVADTCIWRHTVNTHARRVSHFERRSKTGGTRSKSSIGRGARSLKNGTCTDCRKRKSLGNPRTPGGAGCEHEQPSGEKRSAFRKRSRGAKGLLGGEGGGRRALRTCRAEREPCFRENRRMHPARWNGITYASRYPATREFERGHSLIRVACPRFSFAREESGIASSKRAEVYERAWHYEFSVALGHLGLPQAPRPLLPSRKEKGRERKLIANATGTKLPNRLSPGRTGPLISRAGVSTRRTLFLRGGPC